MTNQFKDIPAESGYPLVSVILPCFKMGKFIGEALESIGKQSCSDWEVIVVDDCGPADGTRKAVEAFAANHQDHRVDYIRHAKNQGVSAARNTGLEVAKGSHITFIDPDDLILPSHLEKCMAKFAEESQVGAVASPVEYFWEDDPDKEPYIDLFSDWKTGNFPATLALHNYIQPSAVVLRTQIVRDVGGFDTDPSIQHIEDYDLWIRLAEAGCEFGFLSAVSCRYRRHGGSASSDEQRMHRLHGILANKHLHFLLWMQARLLRSAHEQLAQSRSGPLFSLFLRLDGLLGRVLKRVFGTSGHP